MELQQRYKIHLEAIQEESEQDETRGSKTSESEESCQTPVGVADTEEAMEEEESEEEEELRVLRPRRLTRSPSQRGFAQMTTTESQQEETHSSSVSDLSSCAEDFSDEAVTPGQSTVGKERHFSPRDWKIKISKLTWEKHTPSKPSVKRRRTKRKSYNSPKNISKAELFPRWVVDLMVNIEEATTHRLVVE